LIIDFFCLYPSRQVWFFIYFFYELITLAKFIADRSMGYNNLAIPSILNDSPDWTMWAFESFICLVILYHHGTAVQGRSKTLISRMMKMKTDVDVINELSFIGLCSCHWTRLKINSPLELRCKRGDENRQKILWLNHTLSLSLSSLLYFG